MQLLLPANPLFIWLTLVLAFLLNLVPLGRMPAMPDFLAVVLVFWNVHQSRRVGIGMRPSVRPADGRARRRRCWASTRWPTRCWPSSPSPIHRRLPVVHGAVDPRCRSRRCSSPPHLVSLVVRMIAGGLGLGILLAPV